MRVVCVAVTNITLNLIGAKGKLDFASNFGVKFSLTFLAKFVNFRFTSHFAIFERWCRYYKQ